VQRVSKACAKDQRICGLDTPTQFLNRLPYDACADVERIQKPPSSEVFCLPSLYNTPCGIVLQIRNSASNGCSSVSKFNEDDHMSLCERSVEKPKKESMTEELCS
jgi:hypothetical protein